MISFARKLKHDEFWNCFFLLPFNFVACVFFFISLPLCSFFHLLQPYSNFTFCCQPLLYILILLPPCLHFLFCCLHAQFFYFDAALFKFLILLLARAQISQQCKWGEVEKYLVGCWGDVKDLIKVSNWEAIFPKLFLNFLPEHWASEAPIKQQWIGFRSGHARNRCVMEGGLGTVQPRVTSVFWAKSVKNM